jgi:hypothetical protein
MLRVKRHSLQQRMNLLHRHLQHGHLQHVGHLLCGRRSSSRGGGMYSSLF